MTRPERSGRNDEETKIWKAVELLARARERQGSIRQQLGFELGKRHVAKVNFDKDGNLGQEETVWANFLPFQTRQGSPEELFMPPLGVRAVGQRNANVSDIEGVLDEARRSRSRLRETPYMAFKHVSGLRTRAIQALREKRRFKPLYEAEL